MTAELVTIFAVALFGCMFGFAAASLWHDLTRPVHTPMLPRLTPEEREERARLAVAMEKRRVRRERMEGDDG